VQRYFCPHCKASSTRKRKDISNINHQKLLNKWLFDSFHLNDISDWNKVSMMTLWRWFDKVDLSKIEPPITDAAGKIVILDAIWLDKGLVLLIARTPKYILTWMFADKEHQESWSRLLTQLRGTPLAIVSDGKRGLINAVKLRFPTVNAANFMFKTTF
jgi:hypothetical protein